MDNVKSAADIIKLIYRKRNGEEVSSELVQCVCEYYDSIKSHTLNDSDLHFLRHIAIEAGIPQYYEMLSNFQNDFTDREPMIHLESLPIMLKESQLYTSEDVQLHRFQMEVLDSFNLDQTNRFFLSASTSFGKTFLIYEIIRKMGYDNVCLIFPTIALLSENILKIYTDDRYKWIKEKYKIHTLSDTEAQEHSNLFIYTPERYLSYLDKHDNIALDFIFVDEVYKIDNEFLIDDEQKENERDVAYRICTHIGIEQSVDCLLAGPYININAKNHDSSILRFFRWAGIKLLDFNDIEVVSKKEYVLGKKSILMLEDLERCIHFSSTGKEQRLKELVKHLIDCNESVIIYCPSKAKVESYTHSLLNDSAIPTIDVGPFAGFLNHLENLFKHGKGAEWVVTKALKKGIGVHHGLVPKYIQNEIIRLFNDGFLKILVVTTTITEGVNTSAKNMIVLGHKKGKKDLKTFDAKNIEGRAGRFIHHFTGRVFIFDDEFKKIVESDDEELRHKFFDEKMPKLSVDFPYTDDQYLNSLDREKKQFLDSYMVNELPSVIYNSYKTVSPEDKFHLYQSVRRLTESERKSLKMLISKYNGTGKVTKAGLEVIFDKVKSIVKKNTKILNLIELHKNNGEYCALTNMISVFLNGGFVGAVNYYAHKAKIDAAVRTSAEFVFTTMRYQVVKYLGLFNLCYKVVIAEETGRTIDTVAGFDSLLMRMEYNAATQLGRKASDTGASFRVIDYFDELEKNPDTMAYIDLDDFEKQNADKIRSIIMD